MDSFEVSKIAGGVLCALLVIVGFNTALHIAEQHHGERVVGYSLPMPAAPETEVPGAAVDAPVALPASTSEFSPADVATAAAGGNAEAGAGIFKKCQACHTSESGGANKAGPNLSGIVGRPKASHAGFNYSEALKAKGGNWTLEDLAAFVHNPKGFVPGTKMIFPGIADQGELADLLAYLGTLK